MVGGIFVYTGYTNKTSIGYLGMKFRLAAVAFVICKMIGNMITMMYVLSKELYHAIITGV